MAFYVPLGHRGIFFRIGTFLITIAGGWVYWRASRRRLPHVSPTFLPFDFPELDLIPLPE